MSVSIFQQSFSSVTSVPVAHNLGTTAVCVTVYDGSGNQIIPSNVVTTNSNVVTVTLGVSMSGTVVVAG